MATLALLGTGLAPERSDACGMCCTPYTYLQFCCDGCLNEDFISLANSVTEYVHVVADLAQFVNQANAFRQQLTNDFIILSTIGQNVRSIPSMVTQMAYSQGVQWLVSGASVQSATSNFRSLYLAGESSNNLSPLSPGAYGMMQADMRTNAATTMGYSGQVLSRFQDDMTDIQAIAQSITATENIREDLKVNSRAREKLAAVEQMHTMLLAQWLGVRARSIAFRNQTDLSPPAAPN